MSRYQGPHFKQIRWLGALPGLTSKTPRLRSDLQAHLRSGKRSQYCIPLEETKIVFSLWSDRATITEICAYCWKSQRVNKSGFTTTTRDAFG